MNVYCILRQYFLQPVIQYILFYFKIEMLQIKYLIYYNKSSLFNLQ